ncbi:MAG: L-seryl-tRNA(Sec) selenium transferase, partial [Bacillota bacterium]
MRNLPLLQEIPSVDSLLGTDPLPYPRTLVRRVLNEVLDELRARILDGEVETVPPAEELVRGATERIRRRLGPALRPVVNATGVVVHTNLGRSPLSRAAAEEVMAAATAYSNLEYDLETGERGDRYRGLLDTLRELTGAEDVLLVNNNAGAVLLCLSTLAAGREVAVSRGELVEIGGSFRIPDVMAASGATLTEVGTTNRTHRADYEEAIGDQTVALMKVHASNYRIVGFTSEVSVRELADIAAPRGLVVIYDMGSGILTDLRPLSHPGRYCRPGCPEPA